jgi:hypothetical protein
MLWLIYNLHGPHVPEEVVTHLNEVKSQFLTVKFLVPRPQVVTLLYSKACSFYQHVVWGFTALCPGYS